MKKIVCGRKSAFTLIELLIVIAIIAILALIAIPNFLEAQIRSKVSRTKADMRMIATAIEAYYTDYSMYPLCSDQYGKMEGTVGWPLYDHGNQYCLSHVTTPIAYMTSIPPDEFGKLGFSKKEGAPDPDGVNQTYIYDSFVLSPLLFGVNWYADNNNHAIVYRLGYQWILSTCGPSRTKQRPEDPTASITALNTISGKQGLYVYDPSNGTMSVGFIQRTNKGHYTGEDWAVR